MLIGDVMGQRLEAATIMGRLRSAAHSPAKTGVQPRRLMQALEGCHADPTGRFFLPRIHTHQQKRAVRPHARGRFGLCR
ncbi:MULTISPECIES: SpoIIE family protein phosphatase [unclassified Streptomyces]|uniref:SpoIIE family protein phosphatase n=1 Tax=unclassified Streptomyces TaxID=2593676 RepID=UPI0036E77D95